MITYLDMPAFIPLLVQEPASADCRRIWDAASASVTTRLLYVEATAALHQAETRFTFEPNLWRWPPVDR